MKYMVDHDTREIYIVAPVKASEVITMVGEINAANPATLSYYTFIINPASLFPPPAPQIKTVGDA